MLAIGEHRIYEITDEDSAKYQNDYCCNKCGLIISKELYEKNPEAFTQAIGELECSE